VSRKMSVAVLMLIIVLPALAAGPVRSEAKVYFANPEELTNKLGSLLGSLDICTQGRTDDGRDFIVIDANAGELNAVQASGLTVEVTWKDIRDKFHAMTGCNPDDGSFRDFGYYFTYYEMRDTLYRLVARYPAITQLDSSMRSYQNKKLYCLKISDNPGTTENEPQILVDGATHAREPMGTHACIAYAATLCSGYGVDSLTTWLVNNREIYIVPVMNPDGYVYNSDSGGASSNWRKNRNNTSPRTGPGVDLNRNYAYKWGLNGSGSSGQPGSETYRGPSRFSEPETQVIRDLTLAHKFRLEQDYHTYGQYNLLPWGFSTAWPAHSDDSLAWRDIADTMQHNNSYSTGPTMRVLYETNGGSTDWAFADTTWNSVRKFITFGVSSECGINDFWYGSNDLNYITTEVGLNTPNAMYLTRVAGVYFRPLNVIVNDTTSGNANGRLDPGETANLWFRARNFAIHSLDTAKTITAVLIPSDTHVVVVTPTATFPNCPRRTIANNGASQFQVTCSPDATPGSTVYLRLEMTYTDDGVTMMQPVNYQIVLGNATGVSERRLDYTHATLSLAATPNPAPHATIFRAVVPTTAASSEIRIYSQSGALVRTLPAQSGETRTRWDGRDARNNRVSAGVYFARLSTPAAATWTKVTLTD
jgi:carboxypeptidase T